MIEFPRAYHYMTNCPYRKLDADPLKYTKLSEWFNTHIHDIIVESYIHKDYSKLTEAFTAKIQEIEKNEQIYEKLLKLKLFNHAHYNTQLFAASHETTHVELINSFNIHNMSAVVDLYREKTNLTAELIWFRWNTVLPEIKEQDILNLYVTWNARAFELSRSRRPHLLTVFYPFIGEKLQYMYNTNNNMDVISDLIKMDVLYTTPDLNICPACRLCPEHIRMV